jgi:hypothetical protein
MCEIDQDAFVLEVDEVQYIAQVFPRDLPACAKTALETNIAEGTEEIVHVTQ